MLCLHVLLGRGNKMSQKSAVRLQELGPRLKLQLLKIEEEFCDGKVMYHWNIEKTEEQATTLSKRKAEREAQRKQRRAAQEANVARKSSGDVEDVDEGSDNDATTETKAPKKMGRDGEIDDDEEYYRQEVNHPHFRVPKRGISYAY
jgi:ribosome biogenesis protein SSF1/2